jgi:EAL domain-containing protein (putative c-di-GMP-specific phosphodiesterase class I)
LSRVPLKSFHLFDKACRSKGIELAMRLGLADTSASLTVNVNPVAAVEANSHLSLTCCEAVDAGFPLDRLILEFVEDAQLCDPTSMRQLMSEYQKMGVRIAIDDFGTGYSGLSLLTNLHPDIVKLDMTMVSKIDSDRTTAVVLKAMVAACLDLGVEVIAEGVERPSIMHALTDIGVVLQQGYLFARPEFEALPRVEKAFDQIARAKTKSHLVAQAS